MDRRARLVLRSAGARVAPLSLYISLLLHAYTILRAIRLTGKVSIHLLHKSLSCLYVFHLSTGDARFCALLPAFLHAGAIAGPLRGKSPSAPALMKRCYFAIFPAKKSFTGRSLKSCAAPGAAVGTSAKFLKP